MNLGIERSTIGDIKVGEKEAYLFCQEAMAPYICENLTQVRHTHVKCSIAEQMSEVAQEEPERMVIQVQSLRVDAVIAKVYHLSREKSLELFRAGRVYVDGRLCENNSRILKEGESINARGFGKCRMDSLPKETKKGKLAVTIAVYR
jgi:RNA-binding protein YlmH